MNVIKTFLPLIFVLSFATAVQARSHWRPHVNFGFGFARPAPPVYYAPAPAPAYYYAPTYAPAPCCSCYECRPCCAAPRPRIGFSFGSRHAGFGFSI